MRIAAIVLVVPLALGGCAIPILKPEAPTREAHALKPEPAPKQKIAGEAPGSDGPVLPAPTDVWSLVARDFSWNIGNHAAVRAQIAKLTRRPDAFVRSTAAAAPFLWYIRERLRERRLPAELALVPLVESRFRADAESPFGAAGLWQFMPATGRMFGLRQNRWYDARRDVIASTRAALDYLESLHAQFDGDWLLAVAAYNCGPATVRRALARRGARNFWSIADALPAETGTHVPRLLAAVEIISRPESYGITPHRIADEAYFEIVDLGGPLDFDFLFAIDPDLQGPFAALNPGFRRTVTGPDAPFRALIPRQWVEGVATALRDVPPEHRLPARAYVVRSGDTLSGIAARFDVSVGAIRHRNGLSGNLIKPGRELVIPANGLAVGESIGMTGGDIEHTVTAGESLWSIGKRYGYSSRRLARVNGLNPGAILRPGQVLRIGGRQSGETYAVRPGDSLWTISRRFNVSISELRRWNGLARRAVLQPGQSLIVSRPVTAASRNI